MLEPVPPLSRFLRACNLGGAETKIGLEGILIYILEDLLKILKLFNFSRSLLNLNNSFHFSDTLRLAY